MFVRKGGASQKKIGNHCCRTSIALLIKMEAKILTVLETVKSFPKLVSKDRFPKLEDFSLKMRSYIFYDEASQIYSENRNCTTNETLDDSLRLAATNTGIAKLKERYN